MIVGKLMTSNPVTVNASDTLAVASKKMEAGRFRQVPVLDNGQLVGILTDRDLRQYSGYLERTRVDAVMSSHPFSVRPTTRVETAAHLLMTNKIGGLPVMENGKLVGIVTSSDLLGALVALLGTSDEGVSRIDVALSDSGEIMTATQVIAGVVGQVLGTGTYQAEWNESPVLFFRVRSEDAQRAAKALEEQNFEVLAIHS